MGIAFGLGVVFGVRAVEAALTSVLPVVLLLTATAIVTGHSPRRLCMAAALGCLMGAGAGLRNDREEAGPVLSSSTNVVVGQIRSDVKRTPRGGSAKLDWIDDTGRSQLIDVHIPPAPDVGRGDVVELTGRPDGITGERFFAERVRISQRAGWIESRRRSIREHIAGAVEESVPGTPGALTLGLLIGDDSALTKAENESLRRAGLSHLTAVSGWNVTLVTSAVGLLCLRLGLRGWIWTTLQLVALCAFVWIVGLEPPVTRAAIMGIAGLTAVRLGRPAHSVTVLVMAAATMVAVSPDALTSLSFQLSVVATLGLVLAGRMTDHMEGWRSVVLTPLIATATIGVMTAPLLASEYGTLSLMTVPANVIAAPIVPVAAIAGVIVLVASPVAPLSSLAGWGAWLLCGLLLWLARMLSNVPHGYHEFAPLSDQVQAVMYAILLVALTLILPEGRLLARATSRWAQREPAGAALSASAACLALLTAALTV